MRAGAVITRALSPATASGDQVRVARGTFVIDPNATGPTDPQVEVLQEASLPQSNWPSQRRPRARCSVPASCWHRTPS